MPSARQEKPTPTPEEFLAAYPATTVKIANRLRRLILKMVKPAQEIVYSGWKVIGYRSPHYFCCIQPVDGGVRLVFEHGRRLTDPFGVLTGGGKQTKFALYQKLSDIDSGKLSQLIAQAAENGPKSRSTAKKLS